MKKLLRNIVALGIGLLIALLLLEIFLRLADPFGLRVKGEQIILPAKRSYTFSNTRIPGLDSQIIHHKNSLGFRGPELPADGLENKLSLIAVGGSTTECFYISDGKDWPALLAQKLDTKFHSVWLNNAGLDGHSTFGHQLLLRDFVIKLKPRVVLFLAGCNDVAIDGMTRDDQWSMKKNQGVLSNFEIWNTYQAWISSRLASKRGMGHKPLNDGLRFDPKAAADTAVSAKALLAYRQRLRGLISSCREAGILPVMITQPTLAGADTVFAGGNLRDAMIGNVRAVDYRLQLDAYNRTMKNLCAEMKVPCIAMDALLPKNLNEYYDFFHYTNQGCHDFAEIVSRELMPLLSREFPTFERKN